MQRTNIYLDERQTERLDGRAADEGISRAELIRRLIDRGLSSAGGSNTIHSAIDMSFGAMADVDIPRRASGAREEHLNRMRQLNP